MILAPLLGVLACTEAPAPDSGDSGLAVGCTDEVVAVVSATEIGTAPRLKWQSDEASGGRVRFTNGDGLTRLWADGLEAMEHDAVLVGIVPNAEWTWEILVGEGDEERCVGTGSATNGSLPAGLPQVSRVMVTEPAQGLTVVPVLLGSPQINNWLMIFDEAGRIVWAYPASAGTGEEVWLSTAAFAHDGSGVYFNHQAPSAEDAGWIAEVGFDGEFRFAAMVPGMHTDFREGADGRIAALAWDLREVGAWQVLGDKVVVIEPGGAFSTLWSGFDAIEFDQNGDWPKGFYGADPNVADWTHVNSVSWTPDGEALLVTMTAFSGVARLDAASGATEWLYGDVIGDFPDSPSIVSAPHSAEETDDGEVLLFNRGDYSQHPMDACSWASEVVFNPEAQTVTETARWPGTDCLLVTFLGNAKRLPGDLTLVDWSSAGRIEQLTRSGEPVWSVSLGAGYGFGTADFLASVAE